VPHSGREFGIAVERETESHLREKGGPGRSAALIGMRERIHLVKGELSITSQPAGGTTVYARVPFDAEERRISLAA
jgi:signal transduction histidine kinase